MPPKPKHTAPPPNSQAAAYGYVGGMASHSVTPSHTMTRLKLSSSWITDASGNVNQYLAYTSTRLSTGLPFGELRCHPERSQRIDQLAKKHDIRFKFTGKERDAETGFDYFGARYYDSDVSVWLSVDPLVSKYPNESPYCYAGWNPVMVTDPNGMWKDEGDGNWTAEKGDSWWSLHKQSGMSWKETKAYANKYNKARGQDNWKHVGVGDKVSIPGGGEESSSSSSGGTSSTASTATATPSSSSESSGSTASKTSKTSGCDDWIFGQSVDITLATPGGGYNIEGGWYLGDNGKKGAEFVSQGVAFGIEASAGWNFIFVKPQSNFKFQDLKGMGAGWTINLWIFSISTFGNSSPGYPENSTFDTYQGFKIGVGAGIGGSASPNSNTTFQNWMPESLQKLNWLNIHWH